MGLALPFFYWATHVDLTEKAIVIPDAVGLGIFAAGGTHLALVAGMSPMIAVLMGVITGVVGGVLRDVLINEVPRAFHDHQPYAVIAFAGGWAVVLLGYLNTPEYLDVAIAAILIVTMRLIAVRFKIELFRWRYL